MADRIYIETTIVSYFTGRPSRDVVIAAHQQITHEWWDTRRTSFELCTAELVLVEAATGDPQAAQDRLDVLNDMALLETTALTRWIWRRRSSRLLRCPKTRPTTHCILPSLPTTEYHIY